MAQRNKQDGGKKKISHQLIAGGGAGLCEALTCHPLDTIKVRLQLRAQSTAGARQGFVAVCQRIWTNEGFTGFYRGLGPVATGMVPKMAIRFASFDIYKRLLAGDQQPPAGWVNFTAGLGAGITEAVAVVTPMEVIKIRIQSQKSSVTDPNAPLKYKNSPHALYTIVKEEGFRALYKGVTLTAARQATNQGVNFTVYNWLKTALQNAQPDKKELPSYQTLVIGLISGSMGPMANSPLDVLKTRLQRTKADGRSSWQQTVHIFSTTYQNEGLRAFWKGLTPRLARVAPGQAITFACFEKINGWLKAYDAQKAGQK